MDTDEVTVILTMAEADADVLRQVEECRIVCVNGEGLATGLPAVVRRVGSLPDPA